MCEYFSLFQPELCDDQTNNDYDVPPGVMDPLSGQNTDNLSTGSSHEALHDAIPGDKIPFSRPNDDVVTVMFVYSSYI